MDPQLIFASATSAVIAGGFVWAIMSAKLKMQRWRFEADRTRDTKNHQMILDDVYAITRKQDEEIARLTPLAKLTLDRRARERRYHANRTAAKREQVADA